ncbi:MAG: hypothetical protein ACOX2K_08930 [Bacillota bacterium]|jgi:hypothetical protein
MWRKVAVLMTILGLLLAPAARASHARGREIDNHGRLHISVPAGHTRIGVMRPHAGRRPRMDQVKKSSLELRQLEQMEPELQKERLLEWHESRVQRAQEILSLRERLPEMIIARVAERHAQAVKRATAADAKDKEIARKRLALVKARRALANAWVKKNASRIAQQMILGAEEVLANADQVRERIERGEGLQVLREINQQRHLSIRKRSLSDSDE